MGANRMNDLLKDTPRMSAIPPPHKGDIVISQTASHRIGFHYIVDG